MTKSNELLKKNVLECSLNKTNFEEACTEWRFIDKKSYDKCDKCGHRYNNNWNTNCDECKHWHCTCSKALKHISYYINTNTKKIISVGNSCEKNFKEQLKNNIVSINNLFKVFLNITGIYIGDFDLKKFCQYNKFKVYRILKKDIDNINSIDKLLEYKEYLLEDIWTDAYDVTKLVHDIDDKITQITEELATKKAAEELAAQKAAEELAAKKAAEKLEAQKAAEKLAAREEEKRLAREELQRLAREEEKRLAREAQRLAREELQILAREELQILAKEEECKCLNGYICNKCTKQANDKFFKDAGFNFK